MERVNMKKENCVIVSDTVMQICTMKMMPPGQPPVPREQQEQQRMCMSHLAPILRRT
ncbi:hypothetical protein KIN20_027896 [Parelaphostrongylus tenuis]|uniref:Uncharacterized protein n=1 Tax=Parelaphostrongylus tenuis TaxID=148309 RepID=A0AAD5R0B3_PARTN|nr:hypothetical protein KIN20_027896 [Parelaphostrongylus tenuis]